MKKLSLRTPVIYYLVISITLIICCLSIYLPSFVNEYGLFFAALLILIIGIPHGATDHLVFYSLSINNISIKTKINFYLFYIFSILVYGIGWYFFPSIYINIFIVISAYHLGQSNLYYLTLSINKLAKILIYCCWGFFIILAPIMSNPQQAIAIEKYLPGKSWLFQIVNQKEILLLISIFNFFILSILYILNYATKKDLFREYLNLSVLGLLFYTTPLIISFGVYFGLWHSLGSTLEQLQFNDKTNFWENLINFYLKSLPLIIISLLILLATILIYSELNTDRLLNKFDVIIACFFIFIAIITLPHTIIRDKFYQKYIITV